MMFFDILTLFPGMFEGPFGDSIIRRAAESGVISIKVENIRDYATDRHRTVDDYPYGGDPGMLLMPGPAAAAIRGAHERHPGRNVKTVFLSPCGKPFCHELACEMSALDGLILFCGRYKGLDQRVIDRYVDMEISIGDYVLSGGELGAMVIVDAVTRLLPGALGNDESAGDDSFFNGLLSPPCYTRPEVFEGGAVPEVLLSGNHARIREWKKTMAVERTQSIRPDLIKQ